MKREAGVCDTTMTQRFAVGECLCDTYPENLGPCAWFFDQGVAGKCPYCDHGRACHDAAAERQRQEAECFRWIEDNHVQILQFGTSASSRMNLVWKGREYKTRLGGWGSLLAAILSSRQEEKK